MVKEIRYISSKQQLVNTVKALINENPKSEIMLSGIWSRPIHEDIIGLIIDSQCCNCCKVIIPKLLFKGDISLNLLRGICKEEGQVRINNSVTNNLIIVDRYAFILSFTSRLNSLNIINTTFECAVMTNDEEIVSSIKAQLNNAFENSIPFRM